MSSLRLYGLAVALLVLGAACHDNRLGPPPPPPPPAPPFTGHEREPNNSIATADTVSLGDSIVGQVRLPGDVDYFTVELQAGTNLAVVSTDLPDIMYWSWRMSLFDSTGATIAVNDEYDDWLPGTRIWYTVPKTGRYFVQINNQPISGNADPNATTGDYSYTLRIVSFDALGEQEPNDLPGAARVVALGDTVSGLITGADTDYFAIDLAGGTNLNLQVSSIEVSCAVVPKVRLLKHDGVVLATATSSPYNGSWNPRLEYPIAEAGRYYVSLGVEYPAPLGSNPCYFLKIGTFTPVPPGPGNPVRVIASGRGYSAIASSNHGEVYVAGGICQTPERHATGTVAHLEDDGSLAVIADRLDLMGDVAVDGSGNVLVPAIDSRQAVVLRISPTGQRSTLIRLAGGACALAVGPDGDVWVSEFGTGHTLRVDPVGNVKDSVELGPYVDRMKFSPDGVLYYMRSSSIYRLENGNTTPLTYRQIDAWAFDRDGYLYVFERKHFGYNVEGEVVLVDPGLQTITDPVAYVNQGIGMTFVPDRSGMPTKRLVVLSQPEVAGSNRVIGELNPAGIRAPGP